MARQLSMFGPTRKTASVSKSSLYRAYGNRRGGSSSRSARSRNVKSRGRNGG